MSMLAPHWGQLYWCHVAGAAGGWYCVLGCGLGCGTGVGATYTGVGGLGVGIGGCVGMGAGMA